MNTSNNIGLVCCFRGQDSNGRRYLHIRIGRLWIDIYRGRLRDWRGGLLPAMGDFVQLKAITCVLFLLSACNLGSVNTPPVPIADFPHDPIAAGGIADATAFAKAFRDAPQNSSGGPCISEPTFGAIYPRNFTPPLIEWTQPAGQNVFELRLHVANQVNDLIVYTDSTSYTLPDMMWSGLVAHSQDRDISISIRGSGYDGGALQGPVAAGSSGSVRIAPADAGGAIVYWTTSNGSALKGFRVGDRQVRTVLTPEMITAVGKPTRCIGCHASSPDGSLAFFGRADPQFSVDARSTNGTAAAPSSSQVTANALANLARIDQDLPAFSDAHYSQTDAVVITTLYHVDTSNKWELVWTDLLASSGGTGIIQRAGDPRGAVHPTWSHDGKTIVYVSTNAIGSARVDRGDADLFMVPYNNKSGGQAAPLPGVNLASENQYYPAFSPRDTFIAFNRNPRGSQMYDSPTGEIWIVPANGGEQSRSPANDPQACTGQTSPGLTNSWPRWAPTAWTEGGRNYYWLVFSSKRRSYGMPPRPLPQLFMSAVVTQSSAGGESVVEISPAIYITTQVPSESNHTPAWDDFLIPAG